MQRPTGWPFRTAVHVVGSTALGLHGAAPDNAELGHIIPDVAGNAIFPDESVGCGTTRD